MVSLEPADVEERVLVIQELAVADGALEVRPLPECLPVENDHCREIREVKGEQHSLNSFRMPGHAGGIWEIACHGSKLGDFALN